MHGEKFMYTFYKNQGDAKRQLTALHRKIDQFMNLHAGLRDKINYKHNKCFRTVSTKTHEYILTYGSQLRLIDTMYTHIMDTTQALDKFKGTKSMKDAISQGALKYQAEFKKLFDLNKPEISDLLTTFSQTMELASIEADRLAKQAVKAELAPTREQLTQ